MTAGLGNAKPTRIFRIFISSTFSDLIEERNALQQNVFTKLRELCEKHRCRFQAVDLRWGVSQEAAQDHRTLEICREEILRCQKLTPKPNFIVLLGERYGWQPLPTAIAEAQYDKLYASLASADERELFEKWYERDENDSPSLHRLRRRIGAERQQEIWEQTESRLSGALQKSAARAGLPGSELTAFSASATEQEVELGAFGPDTQQDQVFCFFRTIERPPPNCPLIEPTAEKRHLADRLRARLTAEFPSHVREYRPAYTKDGLPGEYLENLCRDAFNLLSASILREIAAFAEESDFEQQKTAQQKFLHERLREALPDVRQEFRGQVVDRVLKKGGSIVLLEGEGGAGQTTLMAQLAIEIAGRSPASAVLSVFEGSTPQMSGVTECLQHLCHSIDEIYQPTAAPPRSAAEVGEAFAQRLSAATENNPLFVLVDGADRLISESRDEPLSWLPACMPRYATLILSTTGGPYRATANTVAEAVPPLNLQETERMLDAWMQKAKRTLQPHQHEAVVTQAAVNGSPLYLRLLFEEARTWHSDRPASAVPETLEGILTALFHGLEEPSRHGKALVESTLRLFCAARHGVAEDEAVDILSQKGELRRIAKSYRYSPETSQLPFVIWSRLLADLEPFLLFSQWDGTIVLRLGNRRVLDAATARYFAKEPASATHRTIAGYFRSRIDADNVGKWAGDYRRSFRELAYHLFEYARLTGDSAELERLALDETFRERQFLVLRRLESLVECSNYPLQLAIDANDAGRAIQFALARSELAMEIARTFLFRLTPLSEKDAESARAIADSIPRAADRTLALLTIASICWDTAGGRPFARKILVDVAATEHEPIEAIQVDLFIAMVRSLVEEGASEAFALLDLVPECPIRESCRLSWTGRPRPLGELAQRLAKPATSAVPEDEYTRVRRTERLAARVISTGEHNRRPRAVEDRFVTEHGVRGAFAYYCVLAARGFAVGDGKAARFTINRGLFLSSQEERGLIRTHIALARALKRAGELDLGRECRNRATTYLHGSVEFFRDRESRLALLPALEELLPMHTEVLMADPSLGPLHKELGKLAADLVEDPGTLARVNLLRACREWDVNDPDAARASLKRACEGAPASRPFRIALFLISKAMAISEILEESVSLLKAWGISVDDLTAGGTPRVRQALLFREIAAGNSLDVEAVSIGLRFNGQQNDLLRMIQQAAVNGAPFAIIDTLSAQVLLMNPRDVSAMDRVYRALTGYGRISKVAQGLGIYYFPVGWVFFLIAGAIGMACGIPGTQVSRAVAGTFLSSSVVGALADLWIWSRIGVWKVPERSSRTGTASGTMMALWATLALCGPDLPRLVSTDNAGYGFCAGAVAIGMLATGLLFGHRTFGLSAIFRTSALAAALAVLGSTAAAAWWAPNVLDSNWRGGVFLAGTIAAAIGLNLFTKYVAVRRFYGPHAAADRPTLLPVHPPPRDFEDSPLHQTARRGDRHLARGDFKGAFTVYSRVIDDPGFKKLAIKEQSSLYNNRGMAARRSGDPRQAIEDLESSSTLDDRSFSPFQNRALIYAQELGESALAVELFTEAIVRNPADPESYSSRGLARQGIGDWNGSEKDLRMAVRLSPDYADALWNLAKLCQRKSRFQEAASLYARAAEIEPHDREHRIQQFASLGQAGDLPQLEALMKKYPDEASIYRARSGAG